MKFFSLALLVIGAICVTEAKSTKSRMIEALGNTKGQNSGVGSSLSNSLSQAQVIDLLKTLQLALQGLTSGGILSGNGASSSGSSAQGGSSNSPATISSSTTPSPSGSGSGSSSESTTQASTAVTTTTGGSDGEARALGNLLGNSGVLSRVLLGIIKTLLSQTGLDSGSSNMDIDLGDFVTIVESLLNGRNVL